MNHSHLEQLRECADHCRETFFTYCIEKGNEHVAPEHTARMIDCIAICDSAADFVARGSEYHAQVCLVCADICDACADSCEALDDKVMAECADMCRACAEACRTVGKHGSRKAA